MRSRIFLTLVLGMIVSLGAYAGIPAKAENAARGWTVLGSKQVNWRVERDVLRVGAREGSFSKLKIKVTGGSVNIRSMVVTYGNGTKDVIPLKHNFRRGATSRTIDLEGKRRVIKNISFVYDRDRIARNAKVWVSAR